VAHEWPEGPPTTQYGYADLLSPWLISGKRKGFKGSFCLFLDCGLKLNALHTWPMKPYFIPQHTTFHRRPACSQLFAIYNGAQMRIPRIMQSFDFLRSTRIDTRNLVIFTDLRSTFYLHGLSQTIPDMSAFLEWQRRQRREHFPGVRVTYCFGISSGAYAAITSGYFLRVPIVWAFGLPTSQCQGIPPPDDSVSKLCIDLAQLLRAYNGVTEYRLFYNEHCEQDRAAAERLAMCPGVRLFPQSGADHFVLTSLHRSGQLEGLLVPFESA
jgi:hypothetical protein